MKPLCHRCKKKQGTIYLDYTQYSFCKLCFLEVTQNRILQTVRENKLIQNGDKIAIAISGGKDSRCLLESLVKLAKGKREVELIALHVYRGDGYAAKSLLACEKMCKEAKVPLHVASFEKTLGVTFPDVIDITKKCGANRCTVCGVFRRRILDKTARELGCNKLATGHNLTDEAQSYLMNFIRGDITTFSHLGPICLPKRKGLVQRIKPLRDIPETDVKRYVDLKKWSYFPEPCPCRIGSLRFNMVDVMEKIMKARPSAEFSIVHSGDVIRKMKTVSGEELNKCKQCGEPSSKELCKVCELLKLKKKK